jgi:hypothetical protein
VSRRNAVQRGFDAFGKAHFREKRSGVSQRTNNQIEQAMDLQKSQYGP